ncbi:MAG: hypothetical protein V7605_1418, partial [Acidimicrobiaceae bacterium]
TWDLTVVAAVLVASALCWRRAVRL